MKSKPKNNRQLFEIIFFVVAFIRLVIIVSPNRDIIL